MEIDKGRLGRNFGRQAGQYDQYARVQQEMARRLVAQARNHGSQIQRIAEIGCGTGYLTGLLAAAFPQARLTVLDLSWSLVQAARRRLNGTGRVDWLVADGEAYVPQGMDLIISSSVFQWFTQPQQTLMALYDALRPGGWLGFATLGPETFQELSLSLARAAARLPGVTAPQIPATLFAGAEAWRHMLTVAGFEVQVERRRCVEGYRDVMEFLRAVRGMGATTTSPVYLSRRLLAALAAEYESGFRRNGCLPATYEIIAAWARKPL